MKKPIERRLSLEKDFMEFKTNDLLYAFLRSLSTARPVYKNGQIDRYEEYLPVKEYTKNKKGVAKSYAKRIKFSF